MMIKKELYVSLVFALIALICLAFVLMYQYNEERKDAVAELEKLGYVCEKDPLGFYKSCSRPDTFVKLGIDIDFNSCGA